MEEEEETEEEEEDEEETCFSSGREERWKEGREGGRQRGRKAHLFCRQNVITVEKQDSISTYTSRGGPHPPAVSLRSETSHKYSH